MTYQKSEAQSNHPAVDCNIEVIFDVSYNPRDNLIYINDNIRDGDYFILRTLREESCKSFRRVFVLDNPINISKAIRNATYHTIFTRDIARVNSLHKVASHTKIGRE